MGAELEERLGKVLRSVLGLDAAVPAAGISRHEFPEWDSLRHVKIMLELQRELGVKFSAPEIMSLDSYPAILAAILNKPRP